MPNPTPEVLLNEPEQADGLWRNDHVTREITAASPVRTEPLQGAHTRELRHYVSRMNSQRSRRGKKKVANLALKRKHTISGRLVVGERRLNTT